MFSLSNECVVYVESNGYRGKGEIKWINDGYNVPHYSAFISVPFQNSRWNNLGVYEKDAITKAIERCKEEIEMALDRCTLC